MRHSFKNQSKIILLFSLTLVNLICSVNADERNSLDKQEGIVVLSESKKSIAHSSFVTLDKIRGFQSSDNDSLDFLYRAIIDPKFIAYLNMEAKFSLEKEDSIGTRKGVQISADYDFGQTLSFAAAFRIAKPDLKFNQNKVLMIQAQKYISENAIIGLKIKKPVSDLSNFSLKQQVAIDLGMQF